MPNGMIERTHPKLSVEAQCRLLSISRSSFYYVPQGETEMNLDLMLLIRCPSSDACIAERGQAVPGDPVLRCPADDLAPAERRPCRERKAHPAADAPYARSSGKQCPTLFSDPPHCRSTKNPTPASPPRGTRLTPICWAGCALIGPTRSGAPTSPICRCARAFCISWPSVARQRFACKPREGWTGSRERFWLGASPTRWRPSSASKR